MAVFGTGDLKNLPRNISDGLVKKSQSLSTLSQLSGAEPQRFGEHDIITLNGRPRAEFVDPGADKSSTTIEFGAVTALPHKAQVTLRFDEEVQWADEDYQLGVLAEVGVAGGEALSRALDLGAIHAINPLSGTRITGWDNRIANAEKSVEVGADAELTIEDAVGLLMADQETPTGIAFDPSLSWKLATLRYNDGRKKFPEMSLTGQIGNYAGLAAATGNTVSGRPEAEDQGLRAIVGDFQRGFRWGVQRQIPIELIKFGDPDGQGDLKRKNQIALRIEIVYGWYVFEDQFALVKNAAGGE